MTTKHSPYEVLKAQADKIAQVLKAAERGEELDVPFAASLLMARQASPTIKVGIVMDDKIITPEIAWEEIHQMSEAKLSKWIVEQMQEKP